MKYWVMQGFFAVVAAFCNPHYVNGGADIKRCVGQGVRRSELGVFGFAARF